MGMDIGAKVCKDCGVEKPRDAFGKESARPDGKRGYCKPCANARVRESWQKRDVEKQKATAARYRASNPEYRAKARATTAKWRTENPERAAATVKAWHEANPEWKRNWGRAKYASSPEFREAKRRYKAENKDAHAVSRRAYAVANRAKLIAYQVQYRKDHPEYRRLMHAKRKAQKRSQIRGEVTVRDLGRILLHYRHQCAWCSTSLGVNFHWDHVIPLSRGGAHAIGNLVPACASCNLSKNVKFVTEWKRITLTLTLPDAA